MIRKEKEINIVELGNGNTFISQIVKKGETKSMGIAFSNDKEIIIK